LAASEARAARLEYPDTRSAAEGARPAMYRNTTTAYGSVAKVLHWLMVRYQHLILEDAVPRRMLP
jgi:cytochrome b561